MIALTRDKSGNPMHMQTLEGTIGFIETWIREVESIISLSGVELIGSGEEVSLKKASEDEMRKNLNEFGLRRAIHQYRYNRNALTQAGYDVAEYDKRLCDITSKLNNILEIIPI